MPLIFFARNVRVALLQKLGSKLYRYLPCTVGVAKVTNSIVAGYATTVFIVRR